MTYQPKSYRKFLATAATATLVASAVAAPLASAASNFSDVSAKYETAVNYLVENNITSGLTSTQFGVSTEIKRVDAAVMIAKALKLDTTSAPDAGFKDVPSRAQGAVNALVNAKVLSGKTATTFGSEDSLTRGEFAIILSRAYNLSGEGQDLDFTDVNSRYADAVKALVKNDITSGVSATQFGTGNAIKRGDFAIFVQKAATLNVAPEVVGVSAINANEINVTFNKTLDKTSAETIGNYTINGVTLTGADTVTLGSDKKSVIIKLDTAAGAVATGLLTNNTAYTVGVAAAVTFESGETLGSAVSKPLFFNDSSKPTVQQVSTLENGDLQIKVSERFALNGAALFIDGQTVALGGATLSDDTYNGYVTVPKAALPATIESGKSYSIVLSGLDDLAGNSMNLYSGNFTYGAVASAPSIASVSAKDEQTLVVKFSEALQGLTQTNLQVFKGLSDLGIVTGNISNPSGDNKTFEVALPTGADVLFDSTKGETSVPLTVKLTGYKDTAGNLGLTTERNVTVSKDVTKPSISKAEYSLAAGPVNTLTLTLSESAAVATAAQLQGAAAGDNFYITDNNGVRYNVATADITDALAGGTDKSITINLDSVGAATAGTTYTLHVAAGAFTDQSLNGGNDNAVQSVNFTVTGNATDTAKPTAVVTQGASNGQITVTYNEAVKGGNVTGSATLLSAYSLNGAALPTGTTITLDPTRMIATITLPNGYVSTTKSHVLTVSNVQDLAGNTIVANSQAVTVNENKKPEVTGAKIVNGELVLTFSESVAGLTNEDFSDFEVKVNGVDVTEAAGTLAASTLTANEFNISVSDASLATGTVTVKVLSTSDIVDAANNAVVTGTVLTATR